MPIEFSFCLERDLVFGRWYGMVDFEQFEQTLLRYLSDANYRPGRPELIDHSAITDLNMNFNLVRSVLRKVNDQVPHDQVTTHTVIYSPQETVYGMGRMYQILADMAQGVRVEIFPTERESLDALGLGHASIAELLAAETFVPPSPMAG